MSDQIEYVYQSAAQAVIDHGIDTLFGLLGDANLFMADFFARQCGGTFVPVAIEGSAVYMAIAYSQASGNVGVATVTQGPGLTNCFTALIEGVRARRSVVLFSGDTSGAMQMHPQNIDQREIVKATGAGFVQMRSPETATQDIATAFFRAKREKRPIVLNIPVDLNWAEIAHKKIVTPFVYTPAVVSEGEVHEAAIGMIASGRRPLIIAGAGAIDAKDNIVALAERIEAPLATTLKGTGLFRGHPNNIGIFGTLSAPEAYDVIDKADCIIAFGTWLHFLTHSRGELFKGKRVIQINNDLAEVAAFYQPDAVLVADAAKTADNILHWMDEIEITPSGFSRELAPETVAKHPPGEPTKSTDGYINFEYALDRLNIGLPQDRIVLTDGGRYITEVWCRVAVSNPRDFFMTDNFAAIGQGLQHAIGASFGSPDRPVCLFIGDGGFMMGGMTEFNTAVRTKRDLIVIVCNDAAYGAEHIQFKDRGLDPSITEFDWPSFAEIAQSLGGEGVTVRTSDDLETAIAAISNRQGPILVELCLDPHNVPRMRL